MNYENKKAEFDCIIKESSVPKILLRDVINEFKGRWAPCPAHEMYASVEENTNYLKRITEPQTVEELNQSKQKIPAIGGIAEFLVGTGMIEFIADQTSDGFPRDYIDHMEPIFWSVSVAGLIISSTFIG